jgi:ABC-type dipeptide/oligopeptide/nickel transport system permease component
MLAPHPLELAVLGLFLLVVVGVLVGVVALVRRRSDLERRVTALEERLPADPRGGERP